MLWGLGNRSFYMLLGINKKIIAAGKSAACKILFVWAHSVSNHVYGRAASSDGNDNLVKAKCLFVLNHVCDFYEGHSDLFPACEHGHLEPRWWLKKGVNKKLLYLYIFHMNTYF